MHRIGPGAVAPLNPAARWPEGYVAVLREAGAKEQYIPFYIAWVRRFFARRSGRRRRDLGRPEIEAFLREMAGQTGISNWQIQQARDALELYYEKFRGIPMEARPAKPSPAGSMPASCLQAQSVGPIAPEPPPHDRTEHYQSRPRRPTRLFSRRERSVPFSRKWRGVVLRVGDESAISAPCQTTELLLAASDANGNGHVDTSTSGVQSVAG